MLSLGTWYQLRYTEKYRIPIGIRRDYRSSISENEYPVYLRVDDQEMFWATKEEVTINQSGFNSLGLQFMHYKQPGLHYIRNPYKVMKVWVDIGSEKKEPMFGVQQIYKDTVRCKLIGTPEQIDGVNANVDFKEEFDINDELQRIRKYSGNDYHSFKTQIKKMSNNQGGMEFVEVTSIDDYDIQYDIFTNWKTYKREKYASRRIKFLEEELIKIEDKIGHMDKKTKAIYEILAEGYEILNYDIDEKYILAQNSKDIARKFKCHPAEIWKAFYVHIEPFVKKEIKFIEDNIL